MRTNLFFLLLGGLLLACERNPSPPLPSLNGVWQSIGSGWILEIQDSSQYTFYDVTTISCLPTRAASLAEIMESLRVVGDTLSFAKGVMTYKFSRLKQMPSLCTSAVSEQDKREVMYNYEVFAATIREHYAFMELNNINWDLLYEQKREELANAPTEVNLYRTLEETLDTLGDNHAYLEADEALYASMELNATTEENTAEEQLPEYGDFQIANLVAEHHLVEDMTQASWLMKWGKLTDKLGYLAVKAMWLYADLEVPQTLIDEMGYVDAFVSTFQQMDEGTYVDQEVKGAARIMDRVMADLENTQAIVIDLRFNGGGQDAVSFEILRRFNPNREKIVTAKWKHKEGYSPVHVIHLPAEQAAYTKPIYILISPQTGSAAEAFAIASKALDHTKLVGSSSLGATSTSLEKKLPNGWSFAISNEVYMDTVGQNYENVGVPVVYDFDYPRDRQAFFRSVANDLEADKRDILRMINNLE